MIALLNCGSLKYSLELEVSSDCLTSRSQDSLFRFSRLLLASWTCTFGMDSREPDGAARGKSYDRDLKVT